MIKKMGYNVLCASAGKSALEMFRENKNIIDLVFLDMIMPGIGGAEVFEHMKKINPDVRVLISSGGDINDQMFEILKNGSDRYIQKPNTLENLSECFNDLWAEDR
jgi:DNA-binding NtrC family response regulator